MKQGTEVKTSQIQTQQDNSRKEKKYERSISNSDFTNAFIQINNSETKKQKTIFHHTITLTHIIYPLQKEKIAHMVQKIFGKECTQGIPLDNKLLTQLLYEKSKSIQQAACKYKV